MADGEVRSDRLEPADLIDCRLRGPSLIARHKRLSAYDIDGFNLLVEILGTFSETRLTPNILTEASNLIRQIGDPDRSRLTLALGYFTQHASEQYVLSKEASVEEAFVRLGLTDAALLVAARSDAVLLSADNGLYRAALREGLKAINFAHQYEQRFG